MIAWISFFAPPGTLAAGAIPDIVAFTALLAWLIADDVEDPLTGRGL